MSITDQLCETPGCKNRGMKYERNNKFLCRKCARKYDGKSEIESEEERAIREFSKGESDE